MEAQQRIVELQQENAQLKADNSSLSMRVAMLTRRRGAKKDSGWTSAVAGSNNIATESVDAGACAAHFWPHSDLPMHLQCCTLAPWWPAW